ncbi:MAG TPA: L-serine ammonia-lyase, iron-sulfur-dependent, subunit alpha [Clostridiales bacterium]|nr:L-serine ammonia-lyase, iron-sulfur-dependent, subunit alpha [Clostridiales bacterium]
MYTSIESLVALDKERGHPLWQVVLEEEMALSGVSREQLWEQLRQRYHVMRASAYRALDQALPTVGNLISGVAKTHNAYASQGNGLCGSFLNRVMAMALSCSEVNASMGKICAAPTAGSCGILPAVLVGLQERDNLSTDTILEGLLVAGGIGAVITRNATVAGAEGGCQAECGVAAAMAGAAAVHLQKGTVEQMVNAVCFALMNVMGLVCDPVAGLVQVPCAQRNASQAVNALLSADLALAGMQSIIPADQVIEAMYRVGKMLPEQLRETGQGGIAATEKGREISHALFHPQE